MTRGRGAATELGHTVRMALPASTPTPSQWVVVGIDNGGTSNNATVLDHRRVFLVDRLVETASLVREGPATAVEAMAASFANVLALSSTAREAVRMVGLDTPGPASADGVITARGGTNFSGMGWGGFDVRAALAERLQVPVVYNNDGNAAALYAHHRFFGADASARSSVSVIVGTGLGGGVIESGTVIRGAAGMAGELGHVQIPMEGLLEDGQPLPRCNCGFTGDAESVASLMGITMNLLPYWLSRYPDHPLAKMGSVQQAAKQVRTYAERGDEMALRIFGQQAQAIGRLMTVAANFTDPHAYFVGGGVVETTPALRAWFLDAVRAHLQLRAEQATATLGVVADLDMAGARGSAIAAWELVTA